jgi:hypothetical protein
MVKTTQHADLSVSESEEDFYGSEDAEESMEHEQSGSEDEKPS